MLVFSHSSLVRFPNKVFFADAQPRKEKVCVRGRWWTRQGDFLVSSVLSSCWLSLIFGSCISHVLHISGDGRVGEEKVLTLRRQLSFIGQSLCLPVIQGTVKELFSKVVSLLHPVCTWKWFCFQLQGWLQSLCCHWTCEHFRLFCERSRKSCFSWFRALQLLQNWNKLWSDQIWLELYCIHTKLCIYWWLFTESWKYTKTELNS